MALTTGAKVFLGVVAGGLGWDWYRRRAKAKQRKPSRPPVLETEELSSHVWAEMNEQPQMFQLDVGIDYEIPLQEHLTPTQALYSTVTSSDQETAPTNWGSEEVQGPEGPVALGTVYMATHKPGTVLLTFTARSSDEGPVDWQRQALFKIG